MRALWTLQSSHPPRQAAPLQGPQFQVHPHWKRRPQSGLWNVQSKPYDSVVANESATQIHREFILYGHEAAAYPEYVVKYIEA